MCARTEAMREVREAAHALSVACLGIDVSQLRDTRTLGLLPKSEIDFDALIKRLCEIE